MFARLFTFTPVVLGQRTVGLKHSNSLIIITFRFGLGSAFFQRRRSKKMKTKLLVAMLLAGSSLFAGTRFSIGIGVGGYGYAPPPVVAYAPPPVVAYAPPCPGPGFSWVDGYWYRAGPRRAWHAGYWAPPAYGRSFRAEPRYEGNHYANNFAGNRSDDHRYERNDRNRNGFDGNRDGNERGHR
jgi:hypothetical protein